MYKIAKSRLNAQILGASIKTRSSLRRKQTRAKYLSARKKLKSRSRHLMSVELFFDIGKRRENTSFAYPKIFFAYTTFVHVTKRQSPFLAAQNAKKKKCRNVNSSDFTN